MMGKLTKGELLMYLDIADCNRQRAATLAGVSRQTIQNLIKQHRISVPRSDSKLSQKTRSELLKMRDLGIASSTLADCFNISRQRIYRM